MFSWSIHTFTRVRLGCCTVSTAFDDKKVITVVLICISLIAIKPDHIFMFIYHLCFLPFELSACIFCPLFPKGMFLFLLFIRSTLCIPYTNHLFSMTIRAANISSLFLSLLLALYGNLYAQFSIFMYFNLAIFPCPGHNMIHYIFFVFK